MRAALIGTIAWSLSVWWLGEGLGMVFSRMADPLTGAPGGAVLYVFLAILAWPAVSGAGASAWRERQRGESVSVAGSPSVADGSPLGRWARAAWFGLWAAMAGEMLLAPAASASLTAPGGTQAAIVTVGFAAAFAAAAVGVLPPGHHSARPGARRGDRGRGPVGHRRGLRRDCCPAPATDPNTGPLLVLLAVAFWPYPRSATAFIFSRVARMPSRLARRRARPATLQ